MILKGRRLISKVPSPKVERQRRGTSKLSI